MSDPRVTYITNIVCAVFGNRDFEADCEESEQIAQFLNDVNSQVLQCVTNGKAVKFFVGKMGPIKAGFSEVHIVKRGYSEIEAENIASQLLVSTMKTSVSDSLYQYMNRVYEPLLTESSTEVNQQLQNLVVSLKSGLKTTLRKGTDKASVEDLEDVSGILTPIDEVEFWSDMEKINVMSGTDELTRKKAEFLGKHFKKMAKDLYELEDLPLVKIKDFTENAYDIVDTIWTDEEIEPHYGCNRMKHLLQVLTQTIGARVEAEFKKMDVWTSSFSDVRMKLNECMRICKNWKEKVVDLTGTLWRQEANKWTEGTIVDEYLERLINRINQIFEIRQQYDELLRLLSPDDQSRLAVDNAFEPFKKINCFYHSEYQANQWIRAKQDYDKNIEPMEKELCEKLKKEIFSEQCEPTQRLREFQRWKGLLSRDMIKDGLKNERTVLLTQLTEQVDKMRADFEKKGSIKTGMSKIVGDIVWARQYSQKVTATQKVAQSMLSDNERLDDYNNQCNDLVSEIQDYEKKQFKKWNGQVAGMLKNTKEELQLSGRLMEIDYKSGLLKVKYSEKLVTLLKDVRQLQELGFNIDKNIKKIAAQGKKFYKEGVTLKQVANFFNSMSTQIMECQKPMLLDDVIRFEQIVKRTNKKQSMGNQQEVTWDNPVELEEYIADVKESADKLILANRKLRRVHMNCTDLVVEMMSIDLLKNRQLWKEKLDHMRKEIDHVCVGKNVKNAKTWRVHLDFQLYKCLEYQYKMGLESLSENLPQIEADLVYQDSFRQRAIGFKPALEELKSIYYKEIANFITLPHKFKGVDGKPTIFKEIPDRNSDNLEVVYLKAEELFSKLESLLTRMRPWIALGLVDMDEYIEKNFTDVKDWENNFKMLRIKRKELEKLQEYETVDCFKIRLDPFKKNIEDLFQRLHDSLKFTLKASIKKEMGGIDTFITESTSKLEAKPQSVEEIGKAKQDAMAIEHNKGEVMGKYNQCIERNDLLRQIAGEGVKIADIQKRMDNFEVTYSRFSDSIAQRKQELKEETSKKIASIAQEIEKFYNRWEALKPKDRDRLDKDSAMETNEMMKEWGENWKALDKKVQTIIADCKDFGLEEPVFPYLKDLQDDLAQQQESWGFYDNFVKELNELGKEDWLSFSRGKGIYKFQDFQDHWNEKIKELPKVLVTRFIKAEIEKYKECWPLLKICVGEAFEKEHWRSLFYMLNMDKNITPENVKFQNFIDSSDQMVKKSADIKDLGSRAQGEVSIREAIHELRAWCDETMFSLTEYEEDSGRKTPLIKDWKELMTEVSDNQSLLLSLKESRYFSRFKDQVDQFENRLIGIDDYLQKLNVIQRKWVYLVPIFMRGALPAEQQRFNRVDDEYRSIMLNIESDAKVTALCDIGGLKETLEGILTQLDVCQKALNDYLEEKRSKFPRFYFIGDDDLLEILGQSKNPAVIQSHLKKLFAGIFRVEFGKNNSTIIAMKSQAGEYVKLDQPVNVTDEVENWLSDLAKQMKQSLANVLDKEFDIVNNPSQICCLKDMISYSRNAQKAIQSNRVSPYKADLQKRLEEYTSYDHQGDALLLLKLKALILDIIHNIEVLETLEHNHITDPGNWNWFRQLKYGTDNKGMATVGMGDAWFDYTYEYQGNAPKLVHTPLTDKCYLTLTQGMKMGYGGNPYGPAGTGKTESVKALGQAFGRQVLVFNCDEGIDFKSMGRIFIGLVKCGAWGCFDEFNRLLEEQLSAISQQIQVIQWAIKEAQPSLELLGRKIEVNKNAGIFVTMNPAGKGYGGRSKLPDNLKQLFRPVAMSAPDFELIAEVLLFSEGFKSAKMLASKVVTLFQLCKELLSPQQHYDWGLRALKTILTVGGQQIQVEKKKQGKPLDFDREAIILIKAIRINTMSKLTFADANKFEGLLVDMFPGIKVEDISYEELEKAIREVIQEQNLEANQKQISKMLQFHEASRQRMGVVIVGPSGCGKSTIWQVLRKAYEKLKQAMSMHVMNPKSMPRQQLLGLMDHDTREFKDGVLTMAARHVVKEPHTTRCWIICDGDIDPEWIESLNSVLDDNHLLTLPNGERISFGDNVNFIFETDNLRFASPATVSRMGMIFLSEQDVDVHRLVNSWLIKQPEQLRNKLEQWMDDIFYKALEYILTIDDKWIVETTKVGIVNNCLSYMRGIDTKAAFVDAIVRGLGGNLNLEERQIFAQKLYKVSGESPPDPSDLLNCYYDVKHGSLRGFVFDFKDQEFSIDQMKSTTNSPLVTTEGAQRDLNMIRPWIQNDESFILVGPEGCGKNILIRSVIAEQKSTQVAIIHCNAQTSAFHILQKLNQMCNQSSGASGRMYRPKDCNRLIIYLKDINLPKPDKYNTIQLIAFLQQIVCYKGFYDDNLEFVTLERISIVASMAPPSTMGRHGLSCRFTANVRIAYIDSPTAKELEAVCAIYTKTILGHQNFGSGALAGSSKKIARFMVESFYKIKDKFSVDEHRHYLVTPRELSQWIFGIMRYDGGSAEQLVESLVYEAFRIFRDRLVNTTSNNSFRNLETIIYQELKSHLKYPSKIGDIFFLHKASNIEPITVGQTTLGRIPKEDLKKQMVIYMKSYEREFKEMPIVLVDEALEHYASVERVLSNPGGNLLFAGRSGVGRRSITSLVCHALDLEMLSPRVTRDYTIKEFQKFLKEVLIKVGIEGTPTVLYVEDHQMSTREFYEYLNSLISAGEIPGLYSPEELEPLMGQIADEAKQNYECKTVFDYFVWRVKRNLRIVLSLDSHHPDFQSNCASNPAFTNKCSIIWCESWSNDSMYQIALKDLEELEIPDVEGYIRLMLQVHQSCLEHDANPLQYITFIRNYKSTYTEKVESQGDQSKHLSAGLGKLHDAEEQVAELSTSAQESQVLLSEKQKEADKALQQINQAMEQRGIRKQKVEELQAICNKDEDEINERKVLIESELKDIQPKVDAAKAAVGELDTKHIAEIKAYKVPPDPVHDVLGAVLFLMGVKDTTWNNMKKFLSQRGVIQNILGFDAHYITQDVRESVQKMIKKKKGSFEESTIGNVSRACVPLAAWVVANVQYSKVLLSIEPLEKEMNALLAQLHQSQEQAHQCEKELDQIDKQTKKLNIDLQQKNQEAAELKFNLKKAQETLESAQLLLNQLSGEKVRWEQQLGQINQELQTMPIHCLISAAYISYMGKFNEKIRLEKLSEWRGYAKREDFDFTKFMISESQILQWKSEGLPADQLSVENAIMILHSQQTPLIIDPATQATEWLKQNLNKGGEGGVEVLNQQDPKFNTQLELSVRFGKVLIIQEVDQVEGMLFPILRKDLIHQGPRWVVQVGEKDVDYSESFRMFFSTRDSFVDIPPNASSLVTLVNFSVTKSGLEGQLLSTTINFEQPELEKKKTQLLEEEEKLKITLAEYEKKLLEELADSEGAILENKSLIDSLNNTKEKSNEIAKSLKESHELQLDLDKQRKVYLNFSQKGANLFMIINDLIKINNMYQFSLGAFIQLFKKALETKPDAENMQMKLEHLQDTLTKMVFFNIGRSLFKIDRLSYGLHFVHGIAPHLFEENEWEYFNGTAVASTETTHSLPNWAAHDRQNQFAIFTNLFPNLTHTCNFSDNGWINFGQSANCENDFPSSVKHALSDFQNVLIVKVFRPDRLETAMHNFVCKALGKKNISPPPLSMKSFYQNDTSNLEPILFITSPGSDPSDELKEFAEMEIGRQAFHEIAMGGGDNDAALELMREAAEKGDWVCLKNLHLVTPWLPKLEKTFKALQPHKRFRLWLTSEPHMKFPSILLQSSLKVTYESPPGIKNNLARTYQSWAPTFQEGNETRARMLFILAWFNALIQERRKYIPQGWSKYYEFSYGDLKAGETILGDVADAAKGGMPEWEIVFGQLENAIYGGRVDNKFDMRVLKHYLQEFFNVDIFQGNKKMSGLYSIPTGSSIRDYLNFISKLPDQDSPIMFGLPPNIDRSVQRFNSQAILTSLKALKMMSAEELRFDKEKWQQLLGPILKLWKSIYQPANFKGIKIKEEQMAVEDPVEAFVYMEVNGMMTLMKLVHESLNSIGQVIYGSGMLNTKIEQEATSLLKGIVPAAWDKQWEGPENPQNWLMQFIGKANALLQWKEYIESGELLRRRLSLSDLFRPETFLNALRQRSAREQKSSIDELRLISSFEEQRVQATTVVKLKGLYLQGSGYRQGALSDPSSEDLQELLEMEQCEISWVKDDPKNLPYKASETVEVPVYHTINREKLLCTFDIPNSGTASSRIISGVAVFLSGSE